MTKSPTQHHRHDPQMPRDASENKKASLTSRKRREPTEALEGHYVDLCLTPSYRILREAKH